MKITPLNRIMMEQGRTNRWLSRQTGISEVTISLISNDKQRPSVVNAIKIARALNITVEELFGYMADK